MYGLGMSYLLLIVWIFVFSPGAVVIACPVLFGNHLAQIREPAPRF